MVLALSRATCVVVITRASFKSLLRDAPNIQLKVLNALAQRVAGD